MALSENEDEEKSGTENTEFTFVTAQTQNEARSHAMREYWKQRRRRLSEKKAREEGQQPYLPIRPRRHRGPGDSDSFENDPLRSQSSSTSGESLARSSRPRRSPPGVAPNDRQPPPPVDSIRSQALSGMNRALGCGQLDPFDKFPVQLTAQHHKLLHHWLSTYATMMFNDLPITSFNPMRDVWLPLDLSNAASFNAIMAHSAAHLARMKGYQASAEALRFKAEAMRIISIWMKDDDLALSDEVFAAVLRLLTYERYWGTESEWQIHRDGLQRMIDARGGIEALQSNWRLGLVTSLITLMAKPSWFDSSNQIKEISNPSASARLHPILNNQISLHRIRCLWLLSFVQDIGNFMSSTSKTDSHELDGYISIHNALSLIQTDMQRSETATTRHAPCEEGEYKRLACLFFISVLLQASSKHQIGLQVKPKPDESVAAGFDDAKSLEEHLDNNYEFWNGSMEGLYASLFQSFAVESTRASKTDYALNMANVLGSMSSEARHGVERCLLRILCQRPANSREMYEDEWTPDTLLSTIHGA